MRSDIVKGFSANVLAQLAATAFQFISVPIYLSQWGAEMYGIWIVIFTLPSYIALFDLGFATVAGNDMTLSAARGDFDAANCTFQSLRLGALVVSVLAVLFAVVAALLLSDATFPGLDVVRPNDMRVTIVLLVAYSVASLQCTTLLAGFRCARMYPQGVMMTTVVIVTELGASLCVVLMGGGLLASAIAYVAVRGSAVLALSLTLRLKVSWLSLSLERARIRELRRLFPAAVATMALPVGYAISLQGTVIAIALSSTPALVAVYTTVRTMVRVPFQLAAAVNNSITPEFTLAIGRKDAKSASRLFAANFFAVVVILIPAGFLLSFFGKPLVRFWTAGAISAPTGLIVGLAIATAIHGYWHFMVGLLRAVNRYSMHDAFLYPLSATIAVVCTGFVVKLFDLTAAIYPNILLEAMMLVIVFVQYNRFVEFDWPAIRADALHFLHVLLRSLSFGKT
jgi:O-antigen/teichoic acid export membrane protein